MKVFIKLIRLTPWSARFGMLVIATYAVFAAFAPVLTPFGESEIVATEFEPWGENYILGTDNLGRDMLTRLVYGARNTIGIAFLTTCLAFLIGGFAGVMDFVEVARLRGEGLWWVMRREVLPNATLITFGDITPLLPAGAIALLTVGVNFVVDFFLHQTSGLRDGH